MSMTLKPCGSCPRFTYSTRTHAGRIICDPCCDPCCDALVYVQSASVEDLRDLLNAGGGQ